MNTSSHVFSVAQVPDCLRPTRSMQASTLAIFATRTLRAIAVPHIPAGARIEATNHANFGYWFPALAR